MGVVWLMIVGSATGLAAVTLALIAFFSSLVAVMRYRMLLVGSMVAFLGALLLITGWLLSEPGTSKGDALKTGGLAAGAILALYALWVKTAQLQ
jgi:hypothetical protein